MKIDSIFIVKKLNSENDSKVIQISKIIEEVCVRNDIKIIVDLIDINRFTLVIAIGGDGTVLHAMKNKLGSCSVLGINLGRVGFLADLDITAVGTWRDFSDKIEAILTNPDENLVKTRRTLLELSQNNLIRTIRSYAINEFAFAPRYSDQMIEYQMLIDGYDAGIHRANSVIISTATGSTAYNLSAGGSLMMPESDEMQITPVAPIKMTSRPLLVPSKHEIAIKIVNPRDVVIRADGQPIDHNIVCLEDQIYINVSRYRATLCHMKDWNFFDVLMNKLNWEKR